MKKYRWRKSPPPHIGWWNASDAGMRSFWRWWNGRYWSQPAMDHYTAKLAAHCAARRNPGPDPIYWTKYYPKNARVPR